MKHKFFLLVSLGLLLLIIIPVNAGVVSLNPGETVTVNFNTAHLVTKKGTFPITTPLVVAQVKFSLDATGTILTITIKNTSIAETRAALYALDLGVPYRLMNLTQMSATFETFPAGALWQGPTDRAKLNNVVGLCTFAAREVALGNLDDYLIDTTKLTESFLTPGQGGQITVKVSPSGEAKNAPLVFNPVTYFLISDANTKQNKRIQIATTTP